MVEWSWFMNALPKRKVLKKRATNIQMYCPIQKKKKKRNYKDQIIIIPSPLIHETPTVTDKNRTKKLPYSAKKEKEKRTEQKKYICSPFLLLLILFVLRQKDPTIKVPFALRVHVYKSTFFVFFFFLSVFVDFGRQFLLLWTVYTLCIYRSRIKKY